MVIKNARILTEEGFLSGDIRFSRTIEEVGRLTGEAGLDAGGKYLIPGLVDIHTHGAVGEDFSDGRPEGRSPWWITTPPGASPHTWPPP